MVRCLLGCCPKPELIHRYWAVLMVREIQDRTSKQENLHQSASGPSLVSKNLPTGMLTTVFWKLPVMVAVEFIT